MIVRAGSDNVITAAQPYFDVSSYDERFVSL
jgi:hypothetical protein